MANLMASTTRTKKPQCRLHKQRGFLFFIGLQGESPRGGKHDQNGKFSFSEENIS